MKELYTYTIGNKSTIKEAITTIQNSFSRCVVVLNDKKKVVGVFSEGDVLRAILNEISLYTPLNKVLKPSFRYLNNSDVNEAYVLIKKHGITLIRCYICPPIVLLE